MYCSTAILTQTCHCLIALFRLSIFEAPDIPWDCQRVRQEIDLGDVVKIIVARLEQVPQVAGIEMSPQLVGESGELEGTWFYAMKGLLMVKGCWEAKVAAITAADVGREDESPSEDNMHLNVNENGVVEPQQIDALDFGAMNIDMLDDTWIRDILGGYDFNL